MKKKIIISLVCVLIILFIIGIKLFYKSHNLLFISDSQKSELMKILDIEESTSFRPIYKKYYTGFHGKGDGRYYEIKFKISVEDYDKNNLQYNDSENTAELLIDTHFKKKKNNTYICICRISDIGNNIEMFKKLSRLEI